MEAQLITHSGVFRHRSRREAELHELQRCVEDETRRHEAQLSEVRIKHSAAIDSLQEQLDNSKRVRLRFRISSHNKKHVNAICL